MDAMEIVGTFAALDASSKAGEAADRAERSQDASEERLEEKARFITFQDYDLETQEEDWPEGTSFWTRMGERPSKEKLVKGELFSIKNTDISHLTEGADDFGQRYVNVHLKDRSDLDCTSLYVLGTLAEVERRINGGGQ